MSNIRAYVMHEAGHIPGISGMFGGGQTILVDLEKMEVVLQSLIQQHPENEQPLEPQAPVNAPVQESENN